MALKHHIWWRLLQNDFVRQKQPDYNTWKGVQGEVDHIAVRPCQKTQGQAPSLYTISIYQVLQEHYVTYGTNSFTSPIQRTTQLWSSALLKDTSGMTGTRTHSAGQKPQSLNETAQPRHSTQCIQGLPLTFSVTSQQGPVKLAFH